MSARSIDVRSRGLGLASTLVLASAVVYLLLGLSYQLYLVGQQTDGWRVTFRSRGDLPRIVLDRYVGDADTPLIEGDEVVSIGGQSIARLLSDMYSFAPQAPNTWRPGETVRYVVLRDGREISVDVTLEERSPLWILRSLALRPGLNLVYLASAIIGLFALLRAPHLAAARLLFALGVMFTIGAFTAQVALQEVGLPQIVNLAVGSASLAFTVLYSLFMPTVLVHFFLVFPEPKSPLRKHRMLTLAVVYGITPLLIAIFVAANASQPARLYASFSTGWQIATLLGTLTIVISAIHSWRAAQDAVTRAQIRWLMLGILAAVAWIVSSLVLLVVLGPKAQSTRYIWVTDLFVLGLPLSFAVAITRYRLFDIGTVVNRTLVYGALTGVIALLYFGGVAVVQQVFRTLRGGGGHAGHRAALRAVAVAHPGVHRPALLPAPVRRGADTGGARCLAA
jgi:hypothetical protein